MNSEVDIIRNEIYYLISGTQNFSTRKSNIGIIRKHKTLHSLYQAFNRVISNSPDLYTVDLFPTRKAF